MPYLYKRVRTKHKDFITRTKCFYYAQDTKKQRGVRACPTGEGKKLRNARAAYQKRKYEIYTNFDIGDYWITLTWSEKALGSMSPDDAHKCLMKVLSKMRKKAARKGAQLMFYAKTEAGTNVRVHHHLFIKNSADIIGMLFEYWKEFGKIKDFSEIYDFKSGALVTYFLDGGDHKGLDFEKYSHSRNLMPPEVEKHIYPFESFRANPKLPKERDGMYCKIQNLYNGFPDLDGYIYQEYELVWYEKEALE